MPAKRHHVVPRFYLQRFSNEEDRLIAINKASQESFLITTANAGVLTHFYTVETDEGTSDEAEQLLSEIEGRAAPVFGSIDDGQWPLDHASRSVLANYIALQIVRGPDLRRSLDEGVDGVNELLDRWAEATGQAGQRWKISRTEHVMLMLDAGAWLVQPVFDMAWDLVETRSRADFATSDCPVSMWRKPNPGRQASPVGLFTAEEVFFPLDPKRCLSLRWSGPRQDGYQTAQEGHVGGVNMRNAMWAYQFVYLRPPTDDTRTGWI